MKSFFRFEGPLRLRDVSVKLRHFSEQATAAVAFDKTEPNTNRKLLKVAIIGNPNAGKSTLINSLMDRKVCAISKRSHTTRKLMLAIFSHEHTQVVFVDTPGLVDKREINKHMLEKSFTEDLNWSLPRSDLIGVMHDVSDRRYCGSLGKKVVTILETYKHIPSFLILNKVDLVKSKKRLLEITRLITDNCIEGKEVIAFRKSNRNAEESHEKEMFENRSWKYFSDIFMTSALNSDGIDELREYFLKNAKPGSWMFGKEDWCNERPEDILAQAVRAKALDFYAKEIPYKLKVLTEFLQIRKDGTMAALVTIHCPNSRFKKVVLGREGSSLKIMTDEVSEDLTNTFNRLVELTIQVTVPKRDNTDIEDL